MNVLCSVGVGAGAGHRATVHQMAMLIFAYPGPGPPHSQWTWRGGRSMRRWTLPTFWTSPSHGGARYMVGSDKDYVLSRTNQCRRQFGPFLSQLTKEYLAWGDGEHLLMISTHNTVVLACWLTVTYHRKLDYDEIRHWVNIIYSQDAVPLEIQRSCNV